MGEVYFSIAALTLFLVTQNASNKDIVWVITAVVMSLFWPISWIAAFIIRVKNSERRQSNDH